MLQTTIMTVLEPRTPVWEESSITWMMVRALKAKKTLTISGAGANTVGRLKGVVPILQPVPAHANGTPSFFMLMRGLIAVPAPVVWNQGAPYSLTDDSGQVMATFSPCDHPQGTYGVPLLSVAPQITALSGADVAAVQSFFGKLITTFWQQEPINETTTQLHLAPSGQLLTTRELYTAKMPVGSLTIAGGTVAITAGTPARLVTYKKLRGAWNARALERTAGSSSSSCSGGNTQYSSSFSIYSSSGGESCS